MNKQKFNLLNNEIVDSKVTNYKMYKVKKHWVFASALLLSMMGAGMMNIDQAKADVVNPAAQTTVVHATAENKISQKVADQSVAVEQKAASQTTVKNDVKTEVKNENAVSDSKADEQKVAQKAAVKNESKTANQVDQKVETKATSQNNEKVVNNQQKAPTANNQAKANKQAKTDGQVNNQLNGIDEVNVNNQNNSNGDELKETKPTIKNDSNVKAVTNNDKKDQAKKAANNKDRDPLARVQPWTDGHLTITGSGVKGLTLNPDGSYSGELHFHFAGTSISTVGWSSSYLVLGIPEELQRLFSDPYFKQYIIARGSVDRNGSPEASWDYTDSMMHISADGSRIVFESPDRFLSGRKTFTADIYIDLGKAVTETGRTNIDESEYNYLFHSVFVKDDSDLQDWNSVLDYDGQATLQTDDLIPDLQVSAPTINQPVYNTDTTVKGTGMVGATVNVSVNGVVIGSARVGNDGNYTVSIPAQATGTVISVNQTINGITSDSNTATVISHGDQLPAPVLDDVHVGDKRITGSGQANCDITIYNPSGEEIASGQTDGSGHFDLAIEPGNRIYEGEELTGILTDASGNKSLPGTTIVKAQEENMADTTIKGPITAGDKTISGTAEPNSTVSVSVVGTDGAIVNLGTAQADGNGNWSFNLPSIVQLTEGEEIQAVATKDGKTSNTATAPVEAAHEMADTTIKGPITAGDKTISGTAEPNSTVDVKVVGEDGSVFELGTAQADGNGNWSFNVPSIVQLTEGETIQAVATKDGQTSNTATAPVEAAHEMADTTIKGPITAGDKTISGTAEPNSTVDVKLVGTDGSILDLGTVQTDENGNWTYNVPSIIQLTEGEEIQATATLDGQTSNTATAPVEAAHEMKDTTIKGPITAGDKTISGTAEPNSTVDVKLVGTDGSIVDLGTVQADENGNWTFKVPSIVQLTEGEEIQATATLDGQTSNTATTPVEAAHEMKDTTIKGPITAGDKTISGTAEPNSTVDVKLVGTDGSIVDLGTVQADENGNWTYNVPSIIQLTEGEEIQATATLDGQTSNTATAEVQAKEDEVGKPDINSPIYAGDRTISGKGETGDKVQVTVKTTDGRTIVLDPVEVDSQGNWTVDVPDELNLIEGDEISAIQIDKNGKVSEPDTEPVQKKAEVTTPVIDTVTEGDKTIKGKADPNTKVDVSVIGEDGSLIDLGTVETDENGNWSINVPSIVQIIEGETIQAIATNEAGDKSEPGTTVVQPKHVMKPTDIDSVTEGDKTIQGKADPNVSVEVKVIAEDGSEVTIGTVVADENGNWSIDVPGSIALVGGETISANATASDGQTSAATEPVQPKDTHVNPPVINGPIWNDNRSISGTGEPNQYVTVTITTPDGRTIDLDPVQVDSDGNWTVNIPDEVNLIDKDIINAVQTDQDGNVSEPDTEPVKRRVPAPEINDSIYAGGKTISGKGEIGDYVTVTVNTTDGKEITLGPIEVDSEGNWSVDVPDGVTLAENDQITAVQTNDEGTVSEPDTATVLPKQVNKPTIDDVYASDTSITGHTDYPNGEVTIKDKDGNVIAHGQADENGDFDLPVDNGGTLTPGEDISATVTTDDGTSEPDTTTVREGIPTPSGTAPLNKNTVNVTGVQKGNTVTILNADGEVIAEVVANQDGDITVTLDGITNATGDIYYVYQTTPDGKHKSGVGQITAGK